MEKQAFLPILIHRDESCVCVILQKDKNLILCITKIDRNFHNMLTLKASVSEYNAHTNTRESGMIDDSAELYFTEPVPYTPEKKYMGLHSSNNY